MARFLLVVLTACTLITPQAATGQLVGGLFGTRARDSFGGTNGFGAELGVSLPLIPLEVFADGAWFRPDCTDCKLNGWSVGVKFRVLPIPFVRPYVTGGRTWRDLEDPSDSLILHDAGIFTGAGLEISFPGAGIFAEGRYEFLTDDTGLNRDLRQWMFRAGLRLRWGGLPI